MAYRRMLELLREVPAAVTFLRGPDLVVEFAHPIAAAALGGRPLEGRPLLEAVPEFAGQPHVARMRRVYETGERSEETVRVLIDRTGTGRMDETYWHSTYQAVRDENGAIEGLVTFDIEVTKEVQQRRRLELLQEMTSALSLATTVEEVARIVVEEGAAKLGAPRGGIWTLRDDGAKLELLYDKGYTPALREAVAHLPMSSPLPLARVVASGAPAFYESRDEYARAAPESQATTFPVRTSDELAFFCVPLRFEGRTVGVATFNYPYQRNFPEEERRFIETMADQCAIALHRAQLLASERHAREHLQRAIEEQIRLRQRADRLYRLTAALASSRTTDAVVQTFCEFAPGTVPCEWVGMWLLDPERRALVLACEYREGRSAREGEKVALDDPLSPVARAARDRAPSFDAASFATAGSRTSAHVPLRSPRGPLLAVASFAVEPSCAIGGEDHATLLAMTDQCAGALDRARAYEAEASALRKKDEFLAMLGHELRNPLAPILTATSLMRLRGTVTDRELDVLERQGSHLVRLVDDLLDVSRIASGKLVLRRRPIEIAEVVGQAVESVSHALEDKRLRLELDVPRQGFAVDGDRERLVQVMTNLLVNAAKFTPAGRGIAVRAVSLGDAVALEVSDEGEGISADLLPNLFQPFTQGRQTFDRRDGGLGLGLAIARSIIEAHGGHIEAVSGGSNRGTTIRLRLPRLERTAARDAEARQEPPERGKAQGRILIVDDNEDAADTIASFLAALGYDISIATDGPEALTAVARARPDAAILDIGLPGMDGYELARELQAKYGDRAPPLIALTGYAQSSDRDRALANGFLAHFGKPVDVDLLARTVGKIIVGTSAPPPGGEP